MLAALELAELAALEELAALAVVAFVAGCHKSSAPMAKAVFNSRILKYKLCH